MDRKARPCVEASSARDDRKIRNCEKGRDPEGPAHGIAIAAKHERERDRTDDRIACAERAHEAAARIVALGEREAVVLRERLRCERRADPHAEERRDR